MGVMENCKNSLVYQKAFLFAVEVVKICRVLQTQKEYVISRQLLKSGTSIGANYREANRARSKADFKNKIKNM